MGKKGKKKPSQGGQQAEPAPAKAVQGAQGDQPGPSGKKEKKKPSQGGQQAEPAPAKLAEAAQGDQPGPSGKKEKKKPSQGGQQAEPAPAKPAQAAQGDQPGPSGKKGPAQQQLSGDRGQSDTKGSQKQGKKGKGGSSQQQGRPQAQQQSAPPAQHQGGPSPQTGPPPVPAWGRQPAAAAAQQPQPPAQEPRGAAAIPTQAGGPPARGYGRGGPPQQPGGDQRQPQPAGPAQKGGPRGQPQQVAAGGQRSGVSRLQQQGQPSRSPSKSSVSSVTSDVSRMQISQAGDANIVLSSRKSPGREGRVIKVESNHLRLNLGNIEVAHHYDVSIVPDVPKKMMRPVVEAFRRKHFPKRFPAFDGRKNLYTSSLLTNNQSDVLGDEIVLTEDGREKKFKIQIKYANRVDMKALRDFLSSPTTPQEAIQVVDIVLRMAPVATCFPVGRSFFIKPTNGIIDLGEGMEMYQGFYQSAIRGWKPLLNVDVAHKAFPKNINVVDALAQLLSSARQEVRPESLRQLDRRQEETLAKYIKTLRVTYEIPGQPGSKKNYRVNGLGGSASKTTFVNNGETMTILQYFAKLKNYRLRCPDLPTLWVGNPQRPDKILLPMECCVILEGQALNRKMTEQQTSKMIRHAATDTTRRKQKIMDGVNRANYNQCSAVQEFGFSVGNEFEKLDARVLTPPELLYQNKKIARVARGVWRSDTFLTPVTVNKWTIISVGRYPPRADDLKKMASMFEKEARNVGMAFTSRATEPFSNISGPYREIEQYFRTQKDKKYDVIFVIVPDSGPEYSYVKKAAEIVVGSLTQCVKSGTLFRRMNPQTVGNILLKVNSKLNGINHTFSPRTKPDILKRPIMIMGADVTHPGPDSRDIPSVAAVTASHDPKAFQYNICWRLQQPTVEIIEDLEAITIEQLKFFYLKTRVKPEAIVFFRDGVSEGQFEQVKNAEVRAIRAACKKVESEGYEPKITFVVVQKRHHTRLFPLNPKDSEDRNMNVPAGTCVDTEITHPFMQDFYLVSHASIQGVAKPTKYCTLWDDNDMTNDQVEKLAYYLCHMFSRCTRSVSYPAPTYYAHLAAARAKVYIENDKLNLEKLRDEFNKYQIKDEIRKDLPMFFV